MMMVNLRVDGGRADRTKVGRGEGSQSRNSKFISEFLSSYPQLLTIVSAALVQIMVLATTPFMATDVHVLKALLGHFARKVR